MLLLNFLENKKKLVRLFFSKEKKGGKGKKVFKKKIELSIERSQTERKNTSLKKSYLTERKNYLIEKSYLILRNENANECYNHGYGIILFGYLITFG